MLTALLFIFVIICLREYANSQICHPHNMERLNVDYGNDNRPSFVIFGITASCTIFLIPAKFVSIVLFFIYYKNSLIFHDFEKYFCAFL